MILAKQRKAFSMLTAIVVIVVMAVIAAYVTTTAGKTIKLTTDQYRNEQAMLLAKSYTEYAIMAVSADARAGNCLRDINANVSGGTGTNANPQTGYGVQIRIFYIGSNATIGNCAANRRLNSTVVNPDTPLNIIVDAYIQYRDVNDLAKVLSYHKRSLQKI